MQGVAINVQQEIQIDGRSTTVPNDDYAKLSYYLACIGACIPGVIESNYTDYQNPWRFSTETRQAIFVFATILNPSRLEGKAIKRVTQQDIYDMGKQTSGAFITLTERVNLGYVEVDQEKALGLKLSNTEVTKVFVYTSSWLDSYYYTPMRYIVADLENARRPQLRAIPIHNAERAPDNCKNWGKCLLCVCFLALVICFAFLAIKYF